MNELAFSNNPVAEASSQVFHLKNSGRMCPSRPPLHYMFMDFDWPFHSRTLGTRVNYSCPFYTTTESDLAGEQKIDGRYNFNFKGFFS